MFDLGTAIKDFHQARRQARLEELMSRFTGHTHDLLAYDDVRKLLRAHSKIERGLQQVPLDAIVGSVGRYRDFTRTFLPKKDSDQERWAKVKLAQLEHGLPPIELYKIGDAYFVQDGNHRVSIARQEGNETIEAYVTEVETSIPLTPDAMLDDLLIKAEYADFLTQTRLDVLRPKANLSLTSPGKYPLLLEHIEVHRYYMGQKRREEVAYAEAVTHWYDTVFLPAIRLIREQGLLAEFPDRTTADLYVWLAENRAALEAELGWPVSTATAVAMLAEDFSSYKPTRLLSQALQLVTGDSGPTRETQWWYEQSLQAPDNSFFGTILLPLAAADSGWQALHEAIGWAKLERAQLIGLLTVATEREQQGLVAQAVEEAFTRRVDVQGVQSMLKVEVGELTPLTRRLARWADLIVLPVPATADSAGWERIRYASGVTLLVPAATEPPGDGLLLVDDGSAYAHEALLMAVYLQQQWQRPLTVVTSQPQDKVQAAFAKFGLSPQIICWSQVTAVAILETAQQQQCQLVVLGGYTATAVFNQRRDLVEELIRETSLPLLLCR